MDLVGGGLSKVIEKGIMSDKKMGKMGGSVFCMIVYSIKVFIV